MNWLFGENIYIRKSDFTYWHIKQAAGQLPYHQETWK
jgi:hypothetical protein